VGTSLRVDDVHALLAAGTGIFAVGLRIALPVIAAILIANLTLGMLMRTAPQVNLLAIGFPLTLALGFAVLALMLPTLAPTFDAVIASGMRLLVR
jgi:flagellar biosynthetic protein FliR